MQVSFGNMSGWKRLTIVFAVLWLLPAIYAGVLDWYGGVETYRNLITSNLYYGQRTPDQEEWEATLLLAQSDREATRWAFGDESDRMEILDKYAGTSIVDDLLETESRTHSVLVGSDSKLAAVTVGMAIWIAGMLATLMLSGPSSGFHQVSGGQSGTPLLQNSRQVFQPVQIVITDFTIMPRKVIEDMGCLSLSVNKSNKVNDR